jgi:hypothetical protein
MKNLAMLFFLFASGVFAQELPLNEAGKVCFESIVKVDSVKTEALLANAENWLAENRYQTVAIDKTAGKLMAEQSFMVYDKGYISKKVHGKISYNLIIEVKEGKYRYFFKDFVFSYYKEDRTFKVVPTGKKKNLEERNAQGWQHLWENHKKNTAGFILQQMESLKTAMVFMPKKTVSQEKEKW